MQFSSLQPSSFSSTVYRFGSYNILDDQFAKTSIKRGHFNHLDTNKLANWDERRKRIVHNIVNARENSTSPQFSGVQLNPQQDNVGDGSLDVVALQEVSLRAFTYLKKELVNHGYVGEHQKHYRRHDGVALFYKQNKFTERSKFAVNHQQSGLSSLGVDLIDQSGRIFRVFSVHLKGGGPSVSTGVSQADEIRKECDNSPLFNSHKPKQDFLCVLGDFNQDQNAILQQGTKINAFHPPFTHDCDTRESEIGKARKIDWLFFHSPDDCRSFTLSPMHFANQQPHASDHNLIATKMLIENEINSVNYSQQVSQSLPVTNQTHQQSVNPQFQPPVTAQQQVASHQQPNSSSSPVKNQSGLSKFFSSICDFISRFFSCFCFWRT